MCSSNQVFVALSHKLKLIVLYQNFNLLYQLRVSKTKSDELLPVDGHDSKFHRYLMGVPFLTTSRRDFFCLFCPSDDIFF